jgi:uncharacterized protein (TIGR04552 family)
MLKPDSAQSQPPESRDLYDLSLSDLEALALLFRGSSVIDWHRLNFATPHDAHRFIAAQEFREDEPDDVARIEAIRNASISYLRRNFGFPVPKPVANASLTELLMLASSKGHRQLCACTILKVMHIIHHLEARELLFMLPVSDQEVFQLVEKKVYRVIGNLLAQGLPILEFVGGRKNKDSLYTKLLSKQETIAAQIYDKLRFRIVTRSIDDILPVLNGLMRHIFPFNYVIPGESTNTLFDLEKYVHSRQDVRPMLPQFQVTLHNPDTDAKIDNRFTAKNYRVVHFVVDMPVRLPEEYFHRAPPAALHQGRVIFVQTEFQVFDRDTEQFNEMGEASHEAYKQRQKLAVMRRLKLGTPAEIRAELKTGRFHRKTLQRG